MLRGCGEKENSLAVLYVIFAVGNFLIRGLTRRLRRGVQVQSRGVVNSLWQTNRGGAGGERKAPASGIIRQFCRKQFLPGADAPTPARTVGLPHRGGKVLSFEAKESTKESWRHGDSRGGPPRFALFANIGVPGTAVPGSCICSGLPVANCLRQLCPLGTRSLSAQASVCGSPFGAVREHGVSGVA